MTRTELLQRLDVQQPVSAETCFVLLWTYLNQARVAAGENHSRDTMGVHPFRIEPHLPPGPSLRTRLAEAVREIQTRKGDDFELYALRWLMALDLLLDQRQGGQLEESWIPGLDGMEYRVRRRNHFLADSFPRVTSQADQSGSRDLYARFHMAVPRTVQGISIEIRAEEEWAEPALRSRLGREKNRFCVMLWPLQTILDYPALSPGNTLSDFVSLDRIGNEEELRGEICTALATAREQEITLLLFPELAVPPETREDIRLTLETHGPAGHPLMTLFGCCHRQLPEGGVVNEAVLLGPDGTELHCHQKLAAFTKIVTRDRALISGEPIRVGTRLSVLESPLGNLMPLICLDFIHQPLFQALTSSHANVFAVPSLSHTTADHRNRAEDLLRTNLASSFVSNRALAGPTEPATSFFRIPCKDGLRTHLPRSEPREPGYLLFSLEDMLRRVDKTRK